MELREYIKKVIEQFVQAEGNEVTGLKDVHFDIGLTHTGAGGHVIVSDYSPNRIKFTLQVKRA